MEIKTENKSFSLEFPEAAAFKAAEKSTESAKRDDFESVARELGIDIKSERLSAPGAWAAIIVSLLKKNENGSFTNLLDAAADALIRSAKTSDGWAWLDAVTRSFGLNRYDDLEKLSLLRHPDYRPIGERLIEAVVNQTKSPNNTGWSFYAAVIIRALRQLNFDSACESASGQPFAIAPDAIRDPAFIEALAKDPYNAAEIAFCKSSSPAEYFKLLPKGVILEEKPERDVVILCVSRHGEGRASVGSNEHYDSSWHNPVKGINQAKIRAANDEELHRLGVVRHKDRYYLCFKTDPGIIMRYRATPMVVDIAGITYPVLYERTGLGGSSKGIAIWNSADPEMPVWDLYTDVPVNSSIPISEVPQQCSWHRQETVRFRLAEDPATPSHLGRVN